MVREYYVNARNIGLTLGEINFFKFLYFNI